MFKSVSRIKQKIVDIVKLVCGLNTQKGVFG